jgi:hypothetical protein
MVNKKSLLPSESELARVLYEKMIKQSLDRIERRELKIDEFQSFEDENGKKLEAKLHFNANHVFQKESVKIPSGMIFKYHSNFNDLRNIRSASIDSKKMREQLKDEQKNLALRQENIKLKQENIQLEQENYSYRIKKIEQTISNLEHQKTTLSKQKELSLENHLVNGFSTFNLQPSTTAEQYLMRAGVEPNRDKALENDWKRAGEDLWQTYFDFLDLERK